jgi:hypothetical protein
VLTAVSSTSRSSDDTARVTLCALSDNFPPYT